MNEKPIRDLTQLKQRLAEVDRADREQTRRQTSGGSDCWPMSRLDDSSLTHAVT